MIKINTSALNKRFFQGIHTYIIKLYIKHLFILKPWDALYITQEDVALYQATDRTVKLHVEN